MEQYKTNSELCLLLDESIFPPAMVWAGDFRLITLLDRAIDMDNIKAYLIKDVDNDTFLWVIGKFMDDEKINMYPLLKEQSKEQQLEIRNVLVKKGLFTHYLASHISSTISLIF